MPEIVLKDKQGVLRGYSNVDTISVKDSDDNTVEYNNISTRKLVVTANDTYTAPSGIAYDEVEVDVKINDFWKSVVERTVITVTAEDLSGVTEIGNGAFYNCTSLESITIPNSVTSIDDWALSECSSLSTLHIPTTVTYIGIACFIRCSALTGIDIPAGVTEIKTQAFQWCTALKSIVLSDSITSVGNNGFYECSDLASVIIGSGITSIGSSAFANCASLSSFTCLATTPPTIQSNTFTNVPSTMNIYVPSASVDAYKSAQYWDDRAAYIQAIPNS